MAEKGKSAAEVKRLVEVAGLKAKLAMATAQSQQIINTLSRYSEALGRLLQTSRTAVDKFKEVEDEHGACPDEGLAEQMRELHGVVYSLLPKPQEVKDDAEEADVDGKGEPERPADGGLDAVGQGEAPEGEAAPGGAQVEGKAAPDPDAPTQQAG